MLMFILIACAFIWVLIGFVTYWYMETVESNRDITTAQLGECIGISCLGVVAFLMAVVHFMDQYNSRQIHNPKVIFKARGK